GAVVDGVLYLMSKTNVWAYNASLDSWIQKGSMPDKIYGDKISSASCVAADGKILVMGAVEDGPSQTLLNLAGLVHVYDPVTDSWTEATPATPRAYVGIEAVGKNVYVAGGIDNLSYRPTNRMQVFDIRTGIWKEKAPMPNAVYNMAFVEAGGRIFFFKGTDGTRNVEETWIYDPAVDP
ncbi:MAG: kelch repeat-containing protein, partial [Fibrobacteria bacterium]